VLRGFHRSRFPCLRGSLFFVYCYGALPALHSFPTRRSSDLLRLTTGCLGHHVDGFVAGIALAFGRARLNAQPAAGAIFRRHLERSEEHTSELQSPDHLVCRLLLEKKKKKKESN